MDGLSSEEEFKVARHLANLGPIEQNEIRLSWEKPLGYVSFPDGYQFCVFEKEDNLLSHKEMELSMEQAILAAPEDIYANEFAALATRARTILAERPDLLAEVAPATETRLKADELTFEEFAMVKTNYLDSLVEKLLYITRLEQDYIDRDLKDRYLYRVGEDQSGRIVLELTGMDFEYYAPASSISDEAKETMKRIINGPPINQLPHCRSIAIAAFYAMLEKAGWELPPKPNG